MCFQLQHERKRKIMFTHKSRHVDTIAVVKSDHTHLQEITKMIFLCKRDLLVHVLRLDLDCSIKLLLPCKKIICTDIWCIYGVRVV